MMSGRPVRRILLTRLFVPPFHPCALLEMIREVLAKSLPCATLSGFALSL